MKKVGRLNFKQTFSQLGRLGRPAFFAPAEITRGIYRYTLVLQSNQRAVYTIYLETKKKFKGLAVYNGIDLTPCSVLVLDAVSREGRG